MAKRKTQNNTRGGRRKCRRCKNVWNRPSGSAAVVCPRCKERCYRCDVVLTQENRTQPNNKNATLACKSCINEMSVETPSRQARRRDTALVRLYGITSPEYEAILAAQGGGCWVCGKVPLKGQNRLAVDHLHSKGEKKRNPREKRGSVRGLLCWGCNAAIGKFGDDIHKLKRAALYLELWPAQAILKEKSNG